MNSKVNFLFSIEVRMQLINSFHSWMGKVIMHGIEFFCKDRTVINRSVVNNM